MLKNYFRIALRSLWRHSGNTLIHILGLSVGLACCLLIYTFVQYHRNFDRHHEEAARIYRVNMLEETSGGQKVGGSTPYPLAPALRNDFPGWDAVARLHPEEESLISLPDGRKFKADVLFAEPELLDIFDFQSLEGDARQALTQPGQVALTRPAARRFFGKEDAIGESFQLDGKLSLTVGAIIEGLPATSHLQGDLLIAFASFADYFRFDVESWGSTLGGRTYVLLPENTPAGPVEDQLASFVEKYFDPGENSTKFVLQPLSDIHFNTEVSGGGSARSIDERYLWFFGAIGLLILLVACINFINLSTAYAFRRAKEIGVRKAVGAARGQLMAQFFIETAAVAALSAALAALIAQSLLPPLNGLLELQLELRWTQELAPGAFLALSTLVVTLLAGAYPAFVISGFRPVNAIHGKVGERRQGSLHLRRSLVIAQFGIAILLIIGTMTVSRQLEFFRNKSLGFQKEAILTTYLPEPGAHPSLKQEWLRHPGVEEVVLTLGPPISTNGINTRLYPEPGNEKSGIDFVFKAAEYNYSRLFGLELIAGRELKESDSRLGSPEEDGDVAQYNVLINEQMASRLGFEQPEAAIGKQYLIAVNNITATIVGVVRDFNMESLHHEIEPVVIMPFPYLYYQAALKVRAEGLAETIGQVGEAWSEAFPSGLFEYEFLDDTISALYVQEERLFNLFRLFAGLALLIACLGLWGLVSFTTQQRTREIGLRKVLGASLADIVLLLTGEFTRLVGIAFILAAPLSYWGAHRWLANFPYQAGLAPGIFLLAGAAVLLAAWLTVSYRSLRAATANPVEALRSE